MNGCLDITLAGEAVRLLRQHALFWPAERCLMVADLHLGKDYAFGRQGIAIPAGSSEATLQRLDNALKETEASRVFVLGDLVHAAHEWQDSWLAAVRAFLDRHPGLAVTVIAGNHDRHANRAELDARLTWCDHPLPVGPFLLQHEPGEGQQHVIAGHLHPVYRLRSRRSGPGLRLPVFHVTPGCTVLPAFGTFTGGKSIRPDARDRLYVVAGDAVRAVPHTRRSAALTTHSGDC